MSGRTGASEANRVKRSAVIGILAIAAGLVHAQTVQLPNSHQPLAGITTAGQPDAEEFAAAAAAGFKTVIDLRAPQEDRGLDERATVESLGMLYSSLPVDGAAGATYANAAALDRLLGELPGPVLIHCSSGNRAGALLALRAKLNGSDADAALALGTAAGLTGFKAAVEQRLREPVP